MKKYLKYLPVPVWTLALLFFLTLAISPALAQSGKDHKKHHPAGAKDAKSSEKKGGMMGGSGGMGGKGGMGGMMKKMGAPKPKDIYPSLMDLPDLPPEKRMEIKALARQRMAEGTTLMAQALDILINAASKDDFLTMQKAMGKFRSGSAQFESGLAAHRALEEGKAPRNVALQWFKKEMNLVSTTMYASPHGPFGISWFHLITMTLLILFFVLMIWMYFFKMKRAAALMQALTQPPGKEASPKKDTPTASTPTIVNATTETAQKPKLFSGTLILARIYKETNDVHTFRLVNPQGGDIPFHYLPGQFLTLKLNLSGKRVKRSYTIASTPTRKSYCEITVKREEKGLVSRYLTDELKEGDTLELSAPRGDFTFTGKEANKIVLIGAGVGITPLMSVIRYLLDTGWKNEINLLFACKTAQDIIFQQELDYLQKRHANLNVHISATRETEDTWTGLRGRFDKDKIKQCVPEIVSSLTHICGPNSMMEATKNILVELGVPQDQIQLEAFGGPSPSKKETPPQTISEPAVEPTVIPTAAEAASVTFKQSAKSAALPPDKVVLDVAEDLGVEIDYSCRDGSCGTCIVKLLSGEVTMECDDGLDPDEKAEGLILACQAKSNGNLIVDA